MVVKVLSPLAAIPYCSASVLLAVPAVTLPLTLLLA